MKRRSFLSTFAIWLASLPVLGKFFTQAAEAVAYSAAESSEYLDLSCIPREERDKFVEALSATLNGCLKQLPDASHLKFGVRNILSLEENPLGDKVFFRLFSSGKINIPARDPMHDSGDESWRMKDRELGKWTL